MINIRFTKSYIIKLERFDHMISPAYYKQYLNKRVRFEHPNLATSSCGKVCRITAFNQLYVYDFSTKSYYLVDPSRDKIKLFKSSEDTILGAR